VANPNDTSSCLETISGKRGVSIALGAIVRRCG
jgi:hypothetical protein